MPNTINATYAQHMMGRLSVKKKQNAKVSKRLYLSRGVVFKYKHEMFYTLKTLFVMEYNHLCKLVTFEEPTEERMIVSKVRQSAVDPGRNGLPYDADSVKAISSTLLLLSYIMSQRLTCRPHIV